jgi:hypothetical protein
VPSLREAWTRIVQTDDYETFMASIGQAQANARLVSAMLPAEPGRVLFAGAGAGQMLEYLDPAALAMHRLVFTDINPAFLVRLEQRLRAAGLSEFETVVDDLENTALSGPFDVAVVVLVLEHIDWRRGVASLVKLHPGRCNIVIQQNPPEMASAVTPGRVPPGTMGVFVEARPRLVVREELLEAMAEHGYVLDGERVEEVADGKRMVGLSWTRDVG